MSENVDFEKNDERAGELSERQQQEPPMEEAEEGGSLVNAEIRSTEEVINAFLYYKRMGQIKLAEMGKQLSRIPLEHQNLIREPHSAHIQNIKERMDHNYSILRLIVNHGAGMFGEETMKALRIHQLRPPTLDFVSKVFSTIRQIVREWSAEGQPEREATFRPIIEELDRLFPKENGNRHNIRISVPGCGLGRLPYELIAEGFTVEGNEFSMFMLLTSCFILNACKQDNQFTLYPFIFDKSNNWNYADQLRPVTFPDRCPKGEQDTRPNLFSMNAGDYLIVTKDSVFDVVVTAWFIDTAHNIMDYIDHIYEILEPNGIWINVGPLTWHFEDLRDEASIELPYSEVMRLILAKGFIVTSEKRIESKYTVNRRSMLQNEYTCAYFCARKPA